jgi:hypothetical protein
MNCCNAGGAFFWGGGGDQTFLEGKASEDIIVMLSGGGEGEWLAREERCSFLVLREPEMGVAKEHNFCG